MLPDTGFAAQVIHCRWAMLGAAGCIAPEMMGSLQPGFPEATSIVWFKTGVIPPAGEPLVLGGRDHQG
jgi:light-harvesting complex I chlorophyll a/b binding protein 3